MPITNLEIAAATDNISDWNGDCKTRLETIQAKQAQIVVLQDEINTLVLADIFENVRIAEQVEIIRAELQSEE